MIKVIFILCVFTSSLFSQQIETGGLPEATYSRLEFSIDAQEYFSEELGTSPSESNLPENLTAKVQVKAHYLDEESGWRLIFTFPEPVAFKQETNQNSLYLKFNQAIDSPELAKAQEHLGYLIKRLSTGFNTLYIEAKRPVLYSIEALDETFVLDIIPALELPEPSSRSLKIALARLFVEARQYHTAFSLISELEEEFPGNKDVLVLRASLEGLLPRWKNQVQILDELTQAHPFDDDIRKLYYDAYTPHSPYILAERQMQRTVGLAAVQVYRLQAEDVICWNPENTLYAGVQYQLWRGHIGQIVNSQGLTQGFRGGENQLTFYGQSDWNTGTRLRGNFYAQNRALGLGLESSVLLPQIQGVFSARADYHRPYWGVFETLAFQGREDLIKIGIASTYNYLLSMDLNIGGHRVGITGTPNGFTSVLLSGNVFLNFTTPNPIFALNYSLDAEYVTQIKTKKGVDGTSFNPVPYQSFENHTLRLYLIYKWREHMYFTLFGGETFNRLGLNDYTVGVEWKYIQPCPCGWEIGLSAYRFPSTIVSGAVAEYLTANFTWRF